MSAPFVEFRSDSALWGALSGCWTYLPAQVSYALQMKRLSPEKTLAKTKVRRTSGASLDCLTKMLPDLYACLSDRA
jgi:hypothetical protein